MTYEVKIKEIPEVIVYSEEGVLEHSDNLSTFVLNSAIECKRLNPDIQCSQPDYSFCEFIDGRRKNNVPVRYSQAVVDIGISNERIFFRTLSKTNAICVLHKGSYDNIEKAYSAATTYANDNGYKPIDCIRECYIDGIWNKESVDDWLTEIQLPVSYKK